MINYDSILSAFDGKPTLLQWLKMVKKALDESVLKDITLNQDGANAIFTFNFEDGTSISTPAVTLPKGDTGAKGDKGDKGEQGVSVTGVDEVSNEVVGGQTLTTLRFNFSNGTNNEVVVYAENGKNASGGKLYKHTIEQQKDEESAHYKMVVINDKSEPYTVHQVTNAIIDKAIDFKFSKGVIPTYYTVSQITNNASITTVEYYNTYPNSKGDVSTVQFSPDDFFKDTVTEL